MVRCWQDSNLRGKIPMDFESIALTTRPQQLAKFTQVMSIEKSVKSSRTRVRWRPTLIFVDQWTLMINSNRRWPKSFGRVPNCLPNIHFTVQSAFAASCVLFWSCSSPRSILPVLFIVTCFLGSQWPHWPCYSYVFVILCGRFLDLNSTKSRFAVCAAWFESKRGS